MALLYHALGRRPRHQEAAERGHLDRILDRLRIQFGDRAARPAAGVVDDEIEPLAAGIDRGEQPVDLCGPAGVAGDRRRPRLAGQCRQLLRVARRQNDVHSFPGGNERAEAGAGQDARIVSRSSLRGLVITPCNIEKPPVKSTAGGLGP